MNKVLKQFISLSKKYQNDIEYFNYPGKVFYCSGSYLWCGQQLLDYYKKTLPFDYVFIKNGNAIWEMPSSIGLIPHILKQIEKSGTRWIMAHKNKSEIILKNVYKNILARPVMKGNTLPEYIGDLEWSYHLLLDSNIHFQIAVFINNYLTKKIKTVFNKIDDSTLFEMGISDEPSDAAIHDKKIDDLLNWLKAKRINSLHFNDCKKMLAVPDFSEKLFACYQSGYFLYAGYGGVELWTIEKEFALLVKRINSKKGFYKFNSKKIFRELNSEQKFWINVAKYFSWLRDKRRTLQQKFYYYQAQALEEIGRITNLDRVSELEYLRVEQINEKNLKNQKQLKKIIKQQKNGFIYCWEEVDKESFIATGKEANKLNSQYSNFLKIKGKQIVGQTAYKGVARGKVKIILNPKSKNNFRQGDILVTGMTSPDFIWLIKKASAIITEGGGITSHAAIIAREMERPCIIGTKIATKVLKDGDLVEVDADNGIIKILKKV